MKNLITFEEISQLARPCTTDRDMAEALIAEAQRVDIKPRLGDALLWTLAKDDADVIINGGNAEVTPDAVEIETFEEDPVTLSDINPYTLLLNGGTWVDDCGRVHYLTGLKTTLAYYALARIIRDGNIQATTYGAVVKDDQYSADAERTERQRQYREMFAQADSYMAEVIGFLSQNCELFPEYETKGPVRNNRMRVRVIGT